MAGTSPMQQQPRMRHARTHLSGVLSSLLQEKGQESAMNDRESMTDAAFGMGVAKGAQELA